MTNSTNKSESQEREGGTLHPATVPKLGHLPALDGVRGIAALMVIVFHLWQAGFLRTLPFQGIWRICVFGQTGVDLFFVLSGFLITRILLVKKDKDHYFVNFYARRSLRIFPLYYLALIIHYFAMPVLFSDPIPSAKDQIWYWTYLQNVGSTFIAPKPSGPGHFWTLAIEEHFYLVWPAVVFFMSRKNLQRFCIFLVAISLLTRIAFHSYGLDVTEFTLCRMDGLAMGALLALTEPKLADPRITRKSAIFGGGLFVSLALAWPFTSGANLAYLFLAKFSLISLVYMGALAWLVGRPNGISSKLLSTPALTFTGSLSYGLYVYHPLCFRIVRHWSDGQQSLTPGLGLVAVVLTFVVAIPSFYLFEKPILRLKDRFK